MSNGLWLTGESNMRPIALRIKRENATGYVVYPLHASFYVSEKDKDNGLQLVIQKQSLCYTSNGVLSVRDSDFFSWINLKDVPPLTIEEYESIYRKLNEKDGLLDLMFLIDPFASQQKVVGYRFLYNSELGAYCLVFISKVQVSKDRELLLLTFSNPLFK